MGLQFQPEPIAKLKARYPAALTHVFDQESLILDSAIASWTTRRHVFDFMDGPRPGTMRRHVFDFLDGNRLIISRERTPDGDVLTHVSCKMPGNVWTVEMGVKVTALFQHLHGQQTGLKLIGVSDGNVAHFHAVEPTPEVLERIKEMEEQVE